MRRLVLLVALPLFLTACPAEKAPPAPAPATDAPAPAVDAPAPAADAPAAVADAPAAAPDAGTQVATYPVQCGCAIKAVGHCGEYAIVDGKHVEIVGDLGLGSMPFCHKEGLEAKIGGEVKDGKLKFTSFELLK